MPSRTIHLRRVDPLNRINATSLHAFDLQWAALGAAQETLQSSIIERSWLNLFVSSLSTTDVTWLRWADGGLGAGTELRRAYSGLFGRFFARGLLENMLGVVSMIPLQSQGPTDLGNETTVSRCKGGDMPDWVGWSPALGRYVLAEAKGRLTGTHSAWMSKTPNCITKGLRQFERCKVTRQGAKLRTKNWLVASLWATDVNANHQPVMVAWDPEEDGQDLGQDEQLMHQRELERRWALSILRAMGRQEVVSLPDKAPRRRLGLVKVIDSSPTQQAHEVGYSALISSFGIFPLSAEEAAPRLRFARRFASETPGGIMLVVLSEPATRGFGWRSAQITSHGVMGASGLSVFDFRQVEVEAMKSDISDIDVGI
jgi:hypothetical protein